MPLPSPLTMPIWARVSMASTAQGWESKSENSMFTGVWTVFHCCRRIHQQRFCPNLVGIGLIGLNRCVIKDNTICLYKPHGPEFAIHAILPVDINSSSLSDKSDHVRTTRLAPIMDGSFRLGFAGSFVE